VHRLDWVEWLAVLPVESYPVSAISLQTGKITGNTLHFGGICNYYPEITKCIQLLARQFPRFRNRELFDSEQGPFLRKAGKCLGRALEVDTPSIQLPRCDFSPLGRSIYLVGLIVATKLAYRHRCTFNKTRSRLSLYQLLQNFGVNRDYLWGGRDGSGTQSTHAAPPRVQTLSAGLRLTPDEWEVHRMETSPSTQ
jgi:hypothetical protein